MAVAVLIPAFVIRVSNTTLYHVAAKHLGNALWWTRIARMNGLTDPWIEGIVELKIPTKIDGIEPDGIFGGGSNG